MSGETQAIVVNGIPLAIVAALYTAVTFALAPTALRERRRMSSLVFAFLSLFPFLAALAVLLAAFVFVEQRPLGDHLWIAFGAIVIAAIPPVAVLVQLGRGKQLVDRWARSGEVEARAAFLGRELGSVAAVSTRLARTRDPESVARALFAQAQSMLGADLAVLVLVDEIDGIASGVLGVSGDEELDWVPSFRLELGDQPSGVARAVRTRKPIVVDDAETSDYVRRDLVEQMNAKSIVFVPLLIGKKVTGVLLLADTSRKRTFERDEIALLQTVAAEGALALDRVRFASELAEALERE